MKSFVDTTWLTGPSARITALFSRPKCFKMVSAADAIEESEIRSIVTGETELEADSARRLLTATFPFSKLRLPVIIW